MTTDNTPTPAPVAPIQRNRPKRLSLSAVVQFVCEMGLLWLFVHFVFDVRVRLHENDMGSGMIWVSTLLLFIGGLLGYILIYRYVLTLITRRRQGLPLFKKTEQEKQHAVSMVASIRHWLKLAWLALYPLTCILLVMAIAWTGGGSFIYPLAMLMNTLCALAVVPLYDWYRDYDLSLRRLDENATIRPITFKEMVVAGVLILSWVTLCVAVGRFMVGLAPSFISVATLLNAVMGLFVILPIIEWYFGEVALSGLIRRGKTS